MKRPWCFVAKKCCPIVEKSADEMPAVAVEGLTSVLAPVSSVTGPVDAITGNLVPIKSMSLEMPIPLLKIANAAKDEHSHQLPATKAMVAQSAQLVN